LTKAIEDYVEQRDGGYYIAGTRIALDSMILAFKEGKSPENNSALLAQSWPAGSCVWSHRFLSRESGEGRDVLEANGTT
jgi:hypothetical protein